MYEFWYDCVKPKNEEKACVTWIQTKTEGIYLDIVKYAETRFDTSNYQLERTLPKYNI